MNMKTLHTAWVIGLVAAGVILVSLTLVLVGIAPAWSAETEGVMALDPLVIRWGLVAGAAAASISAVAAGYAVAQVGTAAVGVLAEKPELMGRVLILVGLAEGIAIYGLIVAILIFNRLG
jgi:V/A-type H+-transporting ATPase subunit K